MYNIRKNLVFPFLLSPNLTSPIPVSPPLSTPTPVIFLKHGPYQFLPSAALHCPQNEVSAWGAFPIVRDTGPVSAAGLTPASSQSLPVSAAAHLLTPFSVLTLHFLTFCVWRSGFRHM